ncbi:MAG: hypothetical protein OS112_04515 [Methanoregula sp.]|nr:MAG: hypothetical protein OS112_04515 [Methanoregula sp.]
MSLWKDLIRFFKKKELVCEECGKKFDTKLELLNHIHVPQFEHLRRDFLPQRDQERKIIEKEWLNQIYELNRNETYREYLIQAEKFRKEFGKDIKCGICGEWKVDLFDHRGQTYCKKHIPIELDIVKEYKVIAGKHGASRDFIKK